MHHYAIFSALYAPHVGGVESFTAHMAQCLVDAGNRVEVVTSRFPDTPAVETEAGGVRVHRLPARFKLGGRLPLSVENSEQKAMLDDLRSCDIDRVLVNTRFYQHSLVGVRFAVQQGASCLVLDHGSDYVTLGNALADSVLRTYEKRCTERIKAFDPRFAGISMRSAEWLETFGIETRTVVPNAIDAEAYRAQASARDYRKERQLSDDELLVAFVGRLEAGKGADLVARASRSLSHLPMHFVFAGDGSQREELARTCGDNASLLGNVPPSDVAALLIQADLLCLPSRSEGFCTALLEASACACPSLVSDVGGARELIPSSDYGVILSACTQEELEASLASLVEEGREGLRERGKRACERVEECYSWQSSMRALEDAFDAD